MGCVQCVKTGFGVTQGREGLPKLVVTFWQLRQLWYRIEHVVLQVTRCLNWNWPRVTSHDRPDSWPATAAMVVTGTGTVHGQFTTTIKIKGIRVGIPARCARLT